MLKNFMQKLRVTAALVIAAGMTLPMFAVQAQTPVELVFWGDWTGEGETQINTMVKAFNDSQDAINVTYTPKQDMVTAFLTASTSGSAPDVIIWDRFRTALYGPKGVFLPINDFMAKDGITEEQFFTEAIRELSYGDDIYGLPLTVDARALYYNKTLLDAAGVTPPTNWDELSAAAIKLTKRDANGKLEVAGFTVADVGLFNMYLQQAGGTMLSEDNQKTTFNDEKGLAVLNYWNKLVNVDKVYDVGFEAGLAEGTDSFVTGKVAMQYNGPWMLNGYKKYGSEGFEFGVVPPPAGPNGDTGSVMGGFGLVVGAQTKQAEAAWTFIKWWLATPENALLWAKTSNNLPGYLETLEDPFFQEDPYLKPFVDTLKLAKIRPPVPGYPPMEGDALIPQLQLFIQGKQSAEDTLRLAQEQGDPILAENNVQ